MKSLEEIRAEWGHDGFDIVPGNLVDNRLPGPLRDALCGTGLPVRPADSLKLHLRFEDVQIEHRPAEVRLLKMSDFEAGSPFPHSGHVEFDAQTSLDRFLRIGECSNDFTGSGFLNRFICTDIDSEKVYWVYPKLSSGRIDTCLINSSLHAWLASLLACKNFRDRWPALMEKHPEDGDRDRAEYQKAAKSVHEQFLRDLEEADPDGFNNGFWEVHAWNEAILLEV